MSAFGGASMGEAKICGLIIDRREIGDPGAFDDKTDEELMEEARNRAVALGLLPPRPTTDAWPSTHSGETDRHPLTRPCRSAIGRGRQQGVVLGPAQNARRECPARAGR